MEEFPFEVVICDADVDRTVRQLREAGLEPQVLAAAEWVLRSGGG